MDDPLVRANSGNITQDVTEDFKAAAIDERGGSGDGGGGDRGALQYALELDALAIAMACVPAEQAPMPCHLDIRLITGPELLTGSTRLKAGTATKMALNILSTGVMVKLGKVYGNRMVDVAASNSKLVDRSLRILTDLIGLSREQGLPLLTEAKGSVKRALVMAAGSMDLEEAQTLLANHDGNLRQALGSIGVTLKSTAH